MNDTAYYLWVKQSGGGCDYTVGCGEKTFSLNSKTIEEARNEALKRLDELFPDEEEQVKHAIIYSFTENITFMYEDGRKKRLAAKVRDTKKHEIEELENRLKKLKGEG
jgi:ArsR family metal-binding transcriptional regulator